MVSVYDPNGNFIIANMLPPSSGTWLHYLEWDETLARATLVRKCMALVWQGHRARVAHGGTQTSNERMNTTWLLTHIR